MNQPSRVGDLLDVTFDHIWSTQKNTASVLSIIKGLKDLCGSIPLCEVPQTFGLEITQALTEQGKKASTVNRYLSTLGRAFRHARDYGWMDRMITLRPLRESPPRDRVVTPEELKALVEGCPNHAASRLIQFLAGTGCRVSEALKLTRDDVDLPGNTATFRDTKNGDTRVVALTARARDSIHWDAERFQVFPLSPSKFRRAWRAAKKAAGLEGDHELVPHALRHTVATRLVQQGVPLALVARYLGHKDLKTTMRYTHLTSADHAPVLEALS